MDVLEEAKQKGVIRAHGCSCHSIEALRAAAKSPFVEVDLVRINPIGAEMDSSPETVVGVIREMRAAGKGIVGMKILGRARCGNGRMRLCATHWGWACWMRSQSAPNRFLNRRICCSGSRPFDS